MKTLEEDPLVYIVIVTWNDRRVIEPMLESIFTQVDRARTEIICVDNGSTDETIEYLKLRGDLTVIENGLNAGYPVAMNRGARAARGDYIMLCNPDLVFREGAINAMLRELRNDKELGGVNPLIEVPGDPPHPYPVHRLDPGLYYGLTFYSGLMTRFAQSRWLNWHLVLNPKSNTRDIPWIHGCCGLFRKGALATVGGGFDERFFIYFEDADLGRSLRRNGWRLRMANDAHVLHMENQTCRRIAVPSRVFFMESWHKYLRKYHRRPYRALAFLCVGAALLFQLVLQLCKYPFGRAFYLPVIFAYLKTHCMAPFRNLEAEREAELASLKTRWKPLPQCLQPANPSR